MTAPAATITLLDKLIGFDTTSCNSNLELMQFIQDYLQDYGVNSELVHDPALPKANLFATIGPDIDGGIMLSGHTDTVPVSGQNWTRQPFQLSAENGRYYGRGTTDMKGFLACVLAAVPDMAERPLSQPIHLAFSYDEEIGCVGVRHLIERLQVHPHRPAACVIGEPTTMHVVTAHKGKIALQVQVLGKECHSGMAPEGVNAINYAALIVSWLQNLALEKQQNGPFQDTFSPPFTTVHTGTINGGTALNIVPNQCQLRFEIRYIAEEDPHQLLEPFYAYVQTLREQMQAQDNDCDIEIHTLSEYPGLATPENTDIVILMRQLAQSQSSDKKINFGTEGGLFSDNLNITTVVCGPGSMEQGHKPDEFIAAQQLTQCQQFLQRLINHLRV
ncbi:MAG: acetylornithine deacetylase [Gammaproteobacteria bacterium]|jgi:acetylornithine deacetylase|nr:acetylornithine deacetylase [Gammaproteobacteria bacterium]MCP4879107.1 acetylornithine deacetylase [Gammaproteobacteria bacterium]MDP6164554.1 acetylornithine deacetylase [Gammaproteobacteria bacterium]